MLHKHDLTTEELLLLQSELRHREKSLGLGYLMLLGGHLGLHRFYLGRRVSGAIQLALFLLCVISYVFFSIAVEFTDGAVLIATGVLALLSFLPLTVWVIVDLFLLPGMVREWNDREERALLERIEQLRTV
jgi:TM2 domain-containing membrane protein YozV